MQHFIGCDVHTRNQVVAWIDEQTGEIKKRRLEHAGEEVGNFYAQFPRGTVVGIEATFPAHWFERLVGELGHELWVGDAARIRASEVRYQKTDPRDAEGILDLLRTGRFPRIWVPSLEERDLRQLLVHRMKQVRARTQVKNQLHALAISQGVCRGRKLWSAKGRAELERLALTPSRTTAADTSPCIARAGAGWAPSSLLPSLFPCQDQQLGIGGQYFADRFLKLPPGLDAPPHVVHPIFRDAFHPPLALHHKGQHPSRMTLTFRAMAAGMTTAGEIQGQGAGRKVRGQTESTHQFKLRLAKMGGLSATRCIRHIVAVMLQEHSKSKPLLRMRK